MIHGEYLVSFLFPDPCFLSSPLHFPSIFHAASLHSKLLGVAVADALLTACPSGQGKHQFAALISSSLSNY
jgi:hypothetical protein